MASIRKEIVVRANVQQVWDAMRDIGALHTRLVPGFVVGTRLEPGCRIVTFVNGLVVREQIVTIDDEARRMVWSATGWNAYTPQRRSTGTGGTRRPHPCHLGRGPVAHTAADAIGEMMGQGMAAMQAALDRLV